MNRDEKLESLLDRQYWVVDMLPKQVPANSEGQYFKIEQYYLESPRKEILVEKYASILIKLNCYYDFEVWFDEEWQSNPSPHCLSECLLKCDAVNRPLFVLLDSIDALLSLDGEETSMTIYNPNDSLLELLGALASSEGLFLWQP
jgi:hypothetical protein